MLKTERVEHLGKEHLHASIATAVAAFQARPAPVEEPNVAAPEAAPESA
jgi:hypothetical protein